MERVRRVRIPVEGAPPVVARGTQTILLNPGPCITTARVKAAAMRHDVCHRDPEYSQDVARIVDKLRQICGGTPEHEVLLVTGSGTAAMEAAMASCVPQDKKLLVLDNGAFGERLAEIARLHEMNLVHVRYEYGQAIDPRDVEAALAAHPDIAVVAMIHHETSVGILNPVGEIGEICHRHDRLLLVDAVSSLGAEDLDVVRDHIDVLWGSANKCLHGAAGVSFVTCSPRTWAHIADVKPRVYYLDLQRYRKVMREKSQTPFTPAVGTLYALEAACDEFLADGASARVGMYARRNRRLRTGLADLGLRAFTRTGNESHSIVTVSLPETVTFADLYEPLKAAGFVIYDCKAPLQGRYIQIANMGAISETAIDQFLDALAARLAALAPVVRQRIASRA
jgi:2-aminoethylphosphonate-pyruvate transaminase